MLWDWLMASIDPSRPHDVGFFQSWHGRLMAIGWGVCAPLGILIARYCKVMPGQDWPKELDNLFWWRSHLRFQIAAIVLSVIALGLILARSGAATADWHQVLGWSFIAVVAAQVLSGVLRGTKGGPTARAPDGSLHGDHYSMTPRRILFEWFHKLVGRLVLIAGAMLVLHGMWTANAPRWMFLGLVAGWLVLIFAVLVVRRRLPFVTSYQAIWGPDPAHPGNRPDV